MSFSEAESAIMSTLAGSVALESQTIPRSLNAEGGPIEAPRLTLITFLLPDVVNLIAYAI